MRSLWARLTLGLVLLLALSSLTVGVATAAGLNHFLTGRLDDQLAADGGRFAATLEHGAEERREYGLSSDTRGEAEGTLGARLVDGEIVHVAIVKGRGAEPVSLTAGDSRTLTGLTPGGQARTVEFSTLDHYRVRAFKGRDGDVMVTGLPVHDLEGTVRRLALVELTVFTVVLAAAGAAGAFWVRFALRPLRRVATVASRVAELPLSGGEVALPQGVPETGSATEVARLGAAFNRMLQHVEDSLSRRQASQERLRRFAADASHELRTPVATIRGHAELALREISSPSGRTGGEVSDDVVHALRRIEAESARMGHLVDDLLLLARLDTGRPLADEPVDLTRLVLDATSDARVAGPGHRWRMELPEEPLLIRGDESRLHQAIANLLANARVHTPPGTTVTVRLSATADQAVVEVHDDGPGVPVDLQPEIFDRFVRADRSRARSSGGTGLGLAIVHGIVTAHGGRVELVGVPGDTVFRILLPRRGAPDGGPSGEC
ncbi:HAMP domain-containing sensor histidine kinase [Actinocorallia sp. B10E7]|uniref:sensor histidine kinase n=1 Tax=Actinocorallia sp. B10E7 TaxID=3153558 RepID=UPI00325D0403